LHIRVSPGVRDYVHVVDLAQAHVAATKRLESDCGFEVFNVGTGRGYSVLEMIRAMSKACGHEVPYQVRRFNELCGSTKLEYILHTDELCTAYDGSLCVGQLAPRRAGDVASLYADCSLAKTKVCWHTTKRPIAATDRQCG